MPRPTAPSVCSQKKICTRKVNWTRFGHFLVPDNLQPDQRLRLLEIMEYWTTDTLKRVLLPIVLLQSELSNRINNWSVTNYTKKYSSSIFIKDPQNQERTLMISIHDHYTSMQSHYKRDCFDFFRRVGGGPVRFFLVDTKEDGTRVRRTYTTTVAQLNAYHWADRYGVLNFNLTNVENIHQDMKSTNKESVKRNREELLKSPKSRKKRHELSKRPAVTCQVARVNLVMDFSPGRE